MRVFKPNFVTPLPTVFDDGRRLRCVVTAIFHATFTGELCEERLLWAFANEEVEGMVLDEGMPKTQAEYLVHGSCFALGPDVRQSFVKARVGDQEKILAVFGRRTFKLGVPTEPEPFQSVPIRFTHAFGGPGFAENPSGKGFGGRGELPQVEVRGELMSGPNDRPPIAGFGRLDVTLPQRMKKLGTYDTKWQKTRYPGMAEDFDGSYFQLTKPDQWRKEPFKGNESFSVVNMHPEKSQVDGALPGVVARCFVKRKGEDFVDVPMRIDTVHLFPARERQVIVCRGTTSTNSDLLDDIEAVGCGLEWIGRPKSREHYEAVFAARGSKKGGALASLDDTPLLPETPPKPKERIVAPGEGLRQRQLQRKIEHEYERAKKHLLDNDIDLKYLPPLPTFDTSVDPDDVPPLPDEPPTMDSIQGEIAAKRDEHLAKVREEVAKATEGLPPEEAARIQEQLGALEESMKKGHVGPPDFSRAETKRQLEEQATLLKNAQMDASQILAQLNDPAIDQRLRDLDRMTRDSYRQSVQYQGAPPTLSREESEHLRTSVAIRKDAGEPFEAVDLTGADLSGMDLRGANLRGAWLEAANLTGTRLDGADLELAVLARAKLPGADLKTCKLAGANLSEADLTEADLSGLDLSGCFFVRANLTGTRLEGTSLDGADLSDARLTRTNLARSKLKNCVVTNLQLDGASLRDVVWDKVVLYQCTISKVDARGARLSLVMLVDGRVEESRFDDATLYKLQACKIDSNTRFSRCSFVGASLELALFRGVELEGCDFSHANLAKADFSGAKADGTNFEDARGVGARFIGASIRGCNFNRADLMSSLFGSASMDRATFEGANLFRSDFGRTTGDAVDMSGANVKRVRTVPKREEAS